MKTVNKKVIFNYQLFERFEAGVSLMGGEVKAIKQGKANLSNSFAKIMEKEAYLINANIPIEGKKDYNSTRIRKLLLHKKEITSIESKIKANKLTLVPTKMYTKGRRIKLELALAKSKNKVSKKETKKRQDIERDVQRELRDDKRMHEIRSSKH